MVAGHLLSAAQCGGESHQSLANCIGACTWLQQRNKAGTRKGDSNKRVSLARPRLLGRIARPRSCCCLQAQPCAAKSTGRLTPLRWVRMHAGGPAKKSDVSIKLQQRWPLRHCLQRVQGSKQLLDAIASLEDLKLVGQHCCNLRHTSHSVSEVVATGPASVLTIHFREQLCRKIGDKVGPTPTSSHLSKFNVRPTKRAPGWMAWRPWLIEKVSPATNPSSK